MQTTCTKKVDYVEFEHDGKELFAEAEFVIDVTATSNAPEPGYDYEADDIVVHLTDIADKDDNKVADMKMIGNAAERIFEKSELELHEMFQSGYGVTESNCENRAVDLARDDQMFER